MSPCWAEARLANRRIVQADASSANFLNTNPSFVQSDFWSSPNRVVEPGEATTRGYRPRASLPPRQKGLGTAGIGRPRILPPPYCAAPAYQNSEHPWRGGSVVTDGVSD